MKEHAANNLEPVKVILADDDKAGQNLFKDALSRTKIPSELTIIDNGQQLMDKLHDPGESIPDVIFLDINMPVKNGKECLQEIKSDKDLKDIPVVMFTDSDSEEDIEDTYRDGANLYVIKPISFQVLVNIIRKVLTLNWNEYMPRPVMDKFFISEA